MGDLIWARIPQKGYVGVGRVEAPAIPITEFEMDTENGSRPALEVLTKADYHREHADDPDKAEHFVKVNWLETVPAEQAFHKVGFFGNQNSACKPTTPKWRKTVERLKERFANWDKDQRTQSQCFSRSFQDRVVDRDPLDFHAFGAFFIWMPHLRTGCA